MDKELAKQLIDAGFPYSEYWIDNESSGCFISAAGEVMPTLEELVDACGEDFDSLHKHPAPYGEVEGYWTTNFDDEFNSTGDTVGKTPTEAVARLWLSLNKK